MSSQRLTLELDPGFVAGPIESDEEQLVFATPYAASKEIEVVAATPGLGSRRVLGRLPGRVLPAGTIAYERKRKKVFAAGEAGIWEFPFEGGVASLAVGLPDLPAASQHEIHQAYGVHEYTANWVPHKKGRPGYHWAFAIDETTNQLFALAGQEGTLHHLVEIDLDSRTPTAQASMPAFCGGIQLDLKRRRVVLPAANNGPLVLDFEGRRLATLSREGDSGPFSDAAIRPSDGILVLAEQQGGLWLWDWERDAVERLADEAAAPCCAPNGDIFFMRTSSELWVLEKNTPPRLIVRALGNTGGTEHERKRSWVTRPRLSADGRYVLAQLTAILKTKTDDVAVHDAVVVDLVSRRVQHVPRFYEHTISWF